LQALLPVNSALALFAEANELISAFHERKSRPGRREDVKVAAEVRENETKREFFFRSNRRGDKNSESNKFSLSENKFEFLISPKPKT
jgi:hypothetical protein